MKSIRDNLVKTLCLTITGVVVAILLAIDIAVDTWIDSQFDKAMLTKAGMLMTMVSEDETGNSIELHFSGEFMPEFEGSVEPEYFQLWLGEAVFERSGSLALFTENNLPYQDVKLDHTKVIESTLPDGRSGRIIYSRFMPLVRSENKPFVNKSTDNQNAMLIAYATSAEGLNFVLWLLDVVFIVTTIAVVIFIRLFVRKTVEVSLTPLNKMNEQINQLSLSQNSGSIKLSEPIKELIPVEQSLNSFITENRQLYLREKRLTSDISHELKTPITELINLAEVVTQFPDNNELSEGFAPEVLRISNRLKQIVVNVLLLHKYEHIKLPQDNIFDAMQLIERLVSNVQSNRIVLPVVQESVLVRSNQFAVETILNNLLKNAEKHSKSGTNIIVTLQKKLPGRLEIIIENTVRSEIQEAELIHFFEPLWQQDESRSSGKSFGLGLSIANAFAKSINAELSVKLNNSTIYFTLVLIT